MKAMLLFSCLLIIFHLYLWVQHSSGIIHGHSVKGMERVVRCYGNANEASSDLDVKETNRNLVSTRISYVLCTSFSFWICCTFATRKGIFLQGRWWRNAQTIARSHSFEGLYLFTPDMNVQRDGLTLYQDTRNDHLMNHDTNLLATVKENACFYTAQHLKDAKRAQELYHILGAPRVPTFKSMLRMSIIKNCPMTSNHVDIAKKIFGTNMLKNVAR